MIRQKLLEKALNDACTYIHDDGYNGCPGNYDNKTVTNAHFMRRRRDQNHAD